MAAEQPSHSQLLKQRWQDFRSQCFTHHPVFHPEPTYNPELKRAFEAAEKERLRKFKTLKMSKTELLHHLRTEREREHRVRIQHGFDHYPFCWSSKDTQAPCPDLRARLRRAGQLPNPNEMDDLFELFNKTVPLYIVTSPHQHDNRAHPCLQKALGCYLYDKWFRPYESDIDFNQFIAKIIVPIDLECRGPRPSAALVHEIANMHQHIVDYGKAGQGRIVHYMEKTHHAAARKRKHSPSGWWDTWRSREYDTSPSRIKNHYSMSALFESLGIILCTEAWNETGPSEIGQTPVCIFLTGNKTSPLSAPITFDSIEDKIQGVLQLGPRKTIQTTLDDAVDFILNLERRETLAAAAAAGNASNSAANTDYPTPNFPAAYKWFFRDGTEAICKWGPSSGWVDADTYTEWTGAGAGADLDFYALEEASRIGSHMLKL